ncbi:MAG TPA: hypothetical protein QGH10_14500 [Armatimonadota bacterium]|nr:hypothetical protein [Armatimonadota bacterium]
MAFICPDCGTDQLEIESGIELPSDARSDDIWLQIVGCEGCGLRGVVAYEESRRGALNSESWSHEGHRADEALLQQIGELISCCPNPHDARCPCDSHAFLAGGGWRELVAGVPREEIFQVER